MTIDNSMQSLYQLKELNLGCFGCCGNNFAGKTILKRDIRINTKRYNQKKYTIEELKENSK